jgi:hypothetical protein
MPPARKAMDAGSGAAVTKRVLPTTAVVNPGVMEEKAPLMEEAVATGQEVPGVGT